MTREQGMTREQASNRQRQCADCGNFFEPRYDLPADEETVCGPNCPELCDCGDSVSSVDECNKHGREFRSRVMNADIDEHLKREGITYEQYLERIASKVRGEARKESYKGT